MAGIYLHIPFCKQACHYCNFHFSTSLRHKNELIAALLNEIALSSDSFPAIAAEPVETIYFGGGTPSLLTSEELQQLLAALHRQYNVAPGAEVTLEANPDDINSDKLIGWKAAGINRLSIGVQSFFEEDLLWMNRAHNATQALQSLQEARTLFDNITIDLIYGTPGLTDERWKTNVDTAIALGIPHLSCYALTVEPKTPLQKMIRLHKVQDVDSDQQSRQFLLLMQWLEQAGFEHYEISNFAKPGFRSRHNSAYWQGKKYIGLGPSAHSFDGESRWWNIANNQRYIQAIAENKIPFEKEVLTTEQRLNEYIMISLRTKEGIDTEKLETPEWSVYKKDMLRAAKKYLDNGLLQTDGSFLSLTNQGKLLADGIAADLFV